MLQAFVITLREGIEAFLIVAISLAYLRKTGRDRYLPAVYWGIGTSALTSVLAGFLFSLVANQAFWEGTLAIVASILVATLVIHMWRMARFLRTQIQGRLETAARASSATIAWLSIFLFTVLMMTREGMEMALLFGSLLFQVKVPQVLLGALLGLGAAAVTAILWSRYGHKVDLRLFFQVTALFLLVFVGQLLIYGIHELAEAELFPLSTQIHDATEPYGPDGIYGRWLSFAPMTLPLGWLGISWAIGRTRSVKDPSRVKGQKMELRRVL